MQQFLDFMGAMRGGRRFVSLEEERGLLQTATTRHGMTLDDARSALLVGARQSDLLLESEVADEVTAFLSARIGQDGRVSRANFRAAVDFFARRTGNAVSPTEAEQRVRQLVVRAGWTPAPAGWLWRSTAWFDSIPAPTPRARPMPPGVGLEPGTLHGGAPQGGAPMATGDPGSVLSTWAAALRSRNVERILALYTQDALLLATAEHRPLIGPPQIRTYFDRLTSYEGLTVTFQEELQRLSSDRATTISGLYTFAWIDPASGAELVTPARYTYTVRDGDGTRARISLHHSSRLPGNYPGATEI